MEQVLEGPKVVSVVPRVMPSATAQSMAAAKGEVGATSVNLGAAGVSGSAGVSGISRFSGFCFSSAKVALPVMLEPSPTVREAPSSRVRLPSTIKAPPTSSFTPLPTVRSWPITWKVVSTLRSSVRFTSSPLTTRQLTGSPFASLTIVLMSGWVPKISRL